MNMMTDHSLSQMMKDLSRLVMSLSNLEIPLIGLNPMNLEVLLEQAKEKALESNCRVPMVAFLLRNGKPIAYGVNKKGFRVLPFTLK